MKNYLDVNNWRLTGKDAKRRREKFKRQRIHRGFSDWDWWDLDYFYLNLLVSSLRHYAKNTIGFNEAIAPTYEEYQARILKLADMFEELADWEENHNPPEDCKDFGKWGLENSEQLYVATKAAFAELAEVFWSLWD